MAAARSRLFTFGTGNFYQRFLTKMEYEEGYYDQVIRLCQKLETDGIELFFAYNESVKRFSISSESEEWIRKQKRITIHAPPSLPEDEAELQEVLATIDKIYRRLGAEQLIIHPVSFPDRRILDRFGFRVSTENLGRKRNISISMLRKIAEKSGAGLCLDIAHAYLWSKNETRKIIRAFDGKITQVHFSAVSDSLPHVSLSSADADFLYSIEPVRQLKVPVVIEQNMGTMSTSFANKEIRSIKNFFA